MPSPALAVIQLDFDPVVRLGDLEARAQTVLLGLVILAALLLAARIAARTPQPGPYVPAPGLRLDELPFLVLGAAPGAVIGGRLEAVLLHADYYSANPAAIADPGQGSLGLTLAVVGGVAGAAVVARLVEAPLGRWLHAAALPLLFVLAGGKVASILAAEGQGQPTDAPWATAYAGPGPWLSLAPDVPSHPSQAYEAIGTIVVLGALALALKTGAFGRRDGAAFLAAVVQWSMVRALVAFTWRDAPVVGPLRAEHLVLAVVVGGCVAGLLWLRRREGSAMLVPGRTSSA